MSRFGTEMERVELLRSLFSTKEPDSRVLLGIGDDAAILAAPVDPLVWTVDAAVEGVHFRRSELPLEDIGYRATMAAASDLAAMGARPLGILSALVLPADLDDDALASLARGQREATSDLKTRVLGGNLARGNELSITTTVLGATPEPMLRAGARVGDAIFLAGPVGLAAAGRFLVERGLVPSDDAARTADRAFRRPVARIEEGVLARATVRAAIDVSDGLARDLGHLARAGGVRAVIDPTTLTSSELRDVALVLGMDPLELALHGGEDYALLVIAAPGATLPGFLRIGGCEAREAGLGDVALVGPGGEQITVDERGFDHFART